MPSSDTATVTESTESADPGAPSEPTGSTAPTEPGEPGDARRPGWWYAGGALLLTVFSLVVSGVLSLPAFFLGIDTLVGFTAAIVLSELGYVAAAVLFVLVTSRGIGYFDLELPSGWRLVAAVTVGAFVFRTVVVFGALALDINPAPPSIVGADLPLETLVAILLPLSLLLIGPAEELLFRGTIQKYLRERFSATGAIVGAGILFASIHLLAILIESSAGAFVSIGVIFVVGISFGWLYERTGSVVAPMVAHGAYNALIFGSGLLLTRLV